MQPKKFKKDFTNFIYFIHFFSKIHEGLTQLRYAILVCLFQPPPKRAAASRIWGKNGKKEKELEKLDKKGEE